jgi:nucleotide-binding universal stress UspA family protein
MTAIHRILVPTDFSDCSRAALDLACELAPALGAQLTLVHAMTPQAYPIPAVDGAILPDPAAAAEKVATEAHELHEELARARARVPDADSVIVEGDPLPAIEQAAKETGADLIVIGTHGRRGVRHALLGSVAEKLVQRGPCPVLTVRAK